ncbi:MAG: Uma2 family endonuclease [Microcoleaceae cyanobacterium]
MNQQDINQRFEGLTSRKREVLEIFLAGKTDEEIAKNLNIEKSTVRKHIQLICQHFQVQSLSRSRNRRNELWKLFQQDKPKLVKGNQLIENAQTSLEQNNKSESVLLTQQKSYNGSKHFPRLKTSDSISMTQATTNQPVAESLTFEDFIQQNPLEKLWELHNKIVVEIPQPLGSHESITGFLARKITVEFDRLDLPYFIAPKVLVKPEGKESGYLPDILVLDGQNLVNEPLYEKYSTVSKAATIPLVIEVVSTNWSDDYALKFDEYSDIGISEYWIVDYLGLGGKRFIGNPKQPTITVCHLVDKMYESALFRQGELIQSNVFPELNLTVEQVFQAVR